MNRMQEDGRTLTLWELQDSARSMEKALKLEKNKQAYFQSLYDDIRYFANRYCEPATSEGLPPSTEYQALEILDAKESYNRRIARNKEKYIRWTVFLQMLTPGTADILKRRIELKETVDEVALRFAMKEGCKLWEKLEYGRGKSLDAEANDYLTYMRESFPELFKKPQTKGTYEIDGKMVLMTRSDYEDYQFKKIMAEREAFMDSIRQNTANEYSNAVYR